MGARLKMPSLHSSCRMMMAESFFWNRPRDLLLDKLRLYRGTNPIQKIIDYRIIIHADIRIYNRNLSQQKITGTIPKKTFWPENFLMKSNP